MQPPQIEAARYTEPNAEQALLLHQMNLALPRQPPPRITSGVRERDCAAALRSRDPMHA